SRCAAGTIRAIILSRSRSSTVFPARSQALAKRLGLSKASRFIASFRRHPEGDHSLTATSWAMDAELTLATNIVAAGIQSDRKSTRLNSSHVAISYAVFCLKKK